MHLQWQVQHSSVQVQVVPLIIEEGMQLCVDAHLSILNTTSNTQ